MQIFVKVKANARENSVVALSLNTYKVKVTDPPENGKANKRVIKLLAKNLKIKKSQLILTAGHKSSEKIFTII